MPVNILKTAIPKQNSKNSEKGFSLFEVLLVISIVAILGLVVMQMFNDFAKRNVNQMAASHMLRVHNAATEYTKSNFSALLTAIPNDGDIEEVTVADLSADGFLPAGFDATNSFRQDVTNYVRNREQLIDIDGDGTDEEINIFEIISVSENFAFPNERIIDAALAGGAKLGVVLGIDTGPDCCEDTIQSYSGLWSVDRADFSGVTAPTAEAGFLAAYSQVSSSDAFNSDYLYRVAVTGRPELNQMGTNINMAGNNIENAGVVTADNMGVGYEFDGSTGTWSSPSTGTVTINGTGTGSGSFTPFALSIDQAVNVEGGVDINYGVEDAVAGAGCTVDGTGVISTADGSDPDTSCTILGGDLNAQGTNVSMAELTVNNGDFATTTETSINAGGSVTGPAFNALFDEVDVAGNMDANTFTAFTLDARGGGSGIQNFTTAELQSQAVDFGGNTLSVDNVVVGKLTMENGGAIESTSGNDIIVEGQLVTNGGMTAHGINALRNMYIANTVGCDNTNGCPAF